MTAKKKAVLKKAPVVAPAPFVERRRKIVWLGFWYDEKGDPSMARGLLSATTLFMMFVTLVDMAGANVGEVIYDYWQPLMMSFVGWAGGPRIFEKLAPAIAAASGKVRGYFSQTTHEETVVSPDAPPPEKEDE